MGREARSLRTLRLQLNAAFPDRSTVSDGGIGDKAHRRRKSDHNPNRAGFYTARDFTHDPENGLDCDELAQALVDSRDPRIKYIIWDGLIISSKVSPWEWREYKGQNLHTRHLHISVDPRKALYNSGAKWDLGSLTDKPKPKPLVPQKPIEKMEIVEDPPAEEFEQAAAAAGVDPQQQPADVTEIEEPPPYRFWNKIKKDLSAVGLSNLTIQSLQEYAAQAAALPFSAAFWSKAAWVVGASSAAYLSFRVIHFLADTWKQNQRTTRQADFNSDNQRQNIRYIAAPVPEPKRRRIRQLRFWRDGKQ